MNLEKIGIILNEFGIHSVEDFSKVKKGFISHNYKVQTDKGVFFLKQVAKEKVWQIDSIESIEGFFAKNGIPVIEPIKTKDGQLHFIYNEECYVLYPFCTGIEYKRAHMPHEALRNMGKSLADIHLLTKDGIKGEYKEFKYYTFEEREKRLQELDDCLSKAKAIAEKSEFDILAIETLEWKRELMASLSVTFESFDLKDRHLCHGDYHTDNIFFNEDKKVSHIFDLDMSGPAPRMYEVVRSMMLSCFDHMYTDERFEQAGVYIKAYKEKYPFENQQLRDAIEVYYIKEFWSNWLEKFHYIYDSTRTDILYEPCVRTLKYLHENREELFQKIVKLIA